MRQVAEQPDLDPAETAEWQEALEAVAAADGPDRAAFLLHQLKKFAGQLGIPATGLPFSAYRNTIPYTAQPAFPGDLELEERITSIIRWNALAMVVRANRAYGELGGHIASYASAAELFEVGFNHFFRGPREGGAGDLVFFQPHSVPGVYARAFLEGRLTAEDLERFRQEVPERGLSSYPHPWLSPDFWQLPTGSMGIGPVNAVYQARFMRYLAARGLADTGGRRVWGIFGDGEMDEPESMAGLRLAANEGLDNLTFVVNCNLQRLDGPVRGNGQIIQELEALFVGCGWNVIKVLWGSEWDPLFAMDKKHALLRRFAETVDGQYQDLGSKEGDYNREKFFDADPETAALVRHMSDDEIHALKRGGHDMRKLYAAYAAAAAHEGAPTVILAKTKKGFGMGGAGECRMTAHQAKKLDIDALLAFRDRFDLPLTDEMAASLEFFRPPEDSAEIVYLRERRRALGGFLPQRSRAASNPAPARPALAEYGAFALEAEDKEMSTTLAAVRLLRGLLRDKAFGSRVIPIVADEARTFGMDALFRQVGIYSPEGQLYVPEDAGSVMTYRESEHGQLLEEGISEAGAISSWTAAATAYSAHDVETVPVYIFYSMFGFQRVGDLIWAAADQRSRGFLFGATAGRTTLSGEGLQHQDGASHVMAGTVPNCRAYDPAFAYELAVIIEHGLRRMLDEKQDEFFYLTLMNEAYPHPTMPDGVEDGIVKGLYRFTSFGEAAMPRVRLVGSGAIFLEVVAAAEMLARDHGVAADVFSATSFTELARDAAGTLRRRRLRGRTATAESHLEVELPGSVPVVAATDYVRNYPLQIAPYLDARMTALGTDGFGRSATRRALRRFFEVDRHHIVVAALAALADEGALARQAVDDAIARYGIDPDAPDPRLA